MFKFTIRAGNRYDQTIVFDRFIVWIKNQFGIKISLKLNHFYLLVNKKSFEKCLQFNHFQRVLCNYLLSFCVCADRR